jgi:hypothetical protein
MMIKQNKRNNHYNKPNDEKHNATISIFLRLEHFQAWTIIQQKTTTRINATSTTINATTTTINATSTTTNATTTTTITTTNPMMKNTTQ